MRRRLALGVLAMAYSRGVIAAIQLLLVPTLALSWGLPLYGQWLMLSAIPVFLGASDFGFGTTAAMRLIGEVARGDRAEALVTFRAARRMVTLLTGGMLIAVMVIVALLPSSLLAAREGMDGETARATLALLCCYGLLTLQGPLFAAAARSEGRTPQAIAIDSTTQLLEGLAVAGVALAGGTPFDAALAYLTARVVGVGIMRMFARGAAPWIRSRVPASRQRIREMWRPALAAMALPVSQAIYLQGSAMAVGAAAGAAAVPIYASLRTLSRLGLQVSAMFAVPLMPEYTAAHARGDSRQTSVIAGALTLASLGLGVGYALVIGLFGRVLIGLWTHGAIQPPEAMIALTAIALAIGVLWNPLSDLLLAINRHESFSYAYVGCALAAVAATFGLVRALGIAGAAIANLAFETVMAITVLRALRKYGGPILLGPDAILAAIPVRWRRHLRKAE